MSWNGHSDAAWRTRNASMFASMGRDETETDRYSGECAYCDRPLPRRQRTGRPRMFCDNTCRQRMYMQRLMLNEVTIDALGERDGWRCYLCDEPIDPKRKGGPWAPCFDHIIPVTWGGQSVADNLAIVHVRCNLRKGNKLAIHPKDAKQRQRKSVKQRRPA